MLPKFLLLVMISVIALPLQAATLSWDAGNWGDSFAPDTDTDGYEDIIDAFPLDITEWFDTDSDNIGNNADWDDDNDGVPDVVDAAPLDNGNTAEISLPLDAIYKGSKLGSEVLAQ